MNHRELLIALNAGPLNRGALCTLAGQIERWTMQRGDEVSPSVVAALGVSREQLRRALRIRGRAAELADRERRQAERFGVRILTLVDTDYPPVLRDLALPPPVLYCRGELPSAPAVAIVGSRQMSAYGRAAAETFAEQLAATGITVVSGFALGVDTIAHEAAMTTPQGRTVAVLGCGVDVDYPKQNVRLKERLSEQGAVLSEFPFGTSPRPWHFPVRNRVIAALSVATLVVQAAARSGSLITAHQAMELGRDVYAVPGRIFDKLSQGTNGLIADGALVARRPDDIMEGLSLAAQQLLFPEASSSAPPPRSAPPLPPGLGGEILRSLEPGQPRTAEDIATAVQEGIDRVLGILLELELAGWLRREPGPAYVRSMGS